MDAGPLANDYQVSLLHREMSPPGEALARSCGDSGMPLLIAERPYWITTDHSQEAPP